MLHNWRNQERTGKRGKPRLYTDQAIACALRLREVYRLPLRATEGLLRSLEALPGADMTVPCCSTLSRRQAGLAVALDAPAPAEPLHLVVDGMGLKVFGDGEWKARQHGVSKRRDWRKVHLAVDQETGYIRAVGRARWKQESGYHSAQPGRNGDVAPQDYPRRVIGSQGRCRSGHGDDAQAQRAQPDDRARNA